jgi:hypothetical protein
MRYANVLYVSTHCRSPHIDFSIRNCQIRNRSASKTKYFQPVADKENPSKCAVLANVKLQLNELASAVKGIPFQIQKPRKTSDANNDDAPHLRSLQVAEMVKLLPVQPSTELCLNEILSAFREDKDLAENALIFASRSGMLYPHEFREFIKAFRSPSPKFNCQTYEFDDIYSPFSGRLITAKNAIDSELVENSAGKTAISRTERDIIKAPASFNRYLSPIGLESDMEKIIRLLEEDDDPSGMYGKLQAPIQTPLYETVRTQVVPAATADVSDMNPGAEDITVTKTTASENSLLGTIGEYAVVAELRDPDTQNNSVPDGMHEPSSKDHRCHSPCKSTDDSLQSRPAPREINPFKANPKVARTPPKPVPVSAEEEEDAVRDAVILCNSAHKLEKISGLESDCIPNIIVHDEENNRLELGPATPCQSSIHFPEVSFLDTFTSDELEHVSTIITRMSVATASEILKDVAAPVADTGENKGESLSFLHAEIQRLKAELAVAKAHQDAPGRLSELLVPVRVASSSDAPANITNLDFTVGTQSDAYTQSSSILETEIEQARIRSEELVLQQQTIRERYAERTEGVALRKASAAKREFNRSADIRHNRLSLKKTDPLIFDTSFSQKDSSSPDQNDPAAKAEFVGFVEQSAATCSGVYGSPSMVPDFMSSSKQLVPINSELFSVPAPKRKMSQCLGDPHQMRIVFSGRVPSGLNIKDRAGKASRASAFSDIYRPAKISEPCKLPTYAIQKPVGASPAMTATRKLMIERAPSLKEVPSVTLGIPPLGESGAAQSSISPASPYYCEGSNEPEVIAEEVLSEDFAVDFLHCDNSNSMDASFSKDFIPLVGQIHPPEQTVILSEPSPTEPKGVVPPVKLRQQDQEHMRPKQNIGSRLVFVPFKGRHNCSEQEILAVDLDGPKNSDSEDAEEKHEPATKRSKVTATTISGAKTKKSASSVRVKQQKSRPLQITEEVETKLCCVDIRGDTSVTAKNTARELPATVPAHHFVTSQEKIKPSPERTTRKSRKTRNGTDSTELTSTRITEDSETLLIRVPDVPSTNAAASVRPKSSYAYFCDYHLPRLRLYDPTASEIERSNICYQDWSKLSAEEKTSWTAAKMVSSPLQVMRAPSSKVLEVEMGRAVPVAGTAPRTFVSPLKSSDELIKPDGDVDHDGNGLEKAFDNGRHKRIKRVRGAPVVRPNATETTVDMMGVAAVLPASEVNLPGAETVPSKVPNQVGSKRVKRNLKLSKAEVITDGGDDTAHIAKKRNTIATRDSAGTTKASLEIVNMRSNSEVDEDLRVDMLGVNAVAQVTSISKSVFRAREQLDNSVSVSCLLEWC